MKTQAMVTLLLMITSITCMEVERVMNFKLIDGFVAVPESNLPLIKTLHNHYLKHKTRADIEGMVPLFANVSVKDMCLVGNALNVGPYKFGQYYNKLSSDDRLLLIKAAGQYGDDGKKVMLNIPELTKQLIEVYFDDYRLRNHIKSYFKDEDEDCVKNYFKKQLIYSKRVLGALMLKESINTHKLGPITSTVHQLNTVMYPGSLFLNGYHTTQQCVYDIPLYIGDRLHQTYSSCFITDTCECRITDKRGGQCSLWVVHHDNPHATISEYIKHKSDIKGCCFSKTSTGIAYAVTYSDSDMVFSTITIQKDGKSAVKSVRVDNQHGGTIVDVCFNHTHNQFLVATYEGLNSVLRCWAMDGTYSELASYSFKEHAFLEKIFISRNSSGDFLRVLFGVDDQSAVYKYNIVGNGSYVFDSSIELNKPSHGTDEWKCVDDAYIIPREGSMFVYDLSYSPFTAYIAASEKVYEPRGNFFDNVMNVFVSQPDSECYRVYSPDGKFLLCNSLKNKWGVFWVETVVKDAVTHKQILSIDTLYQNFIAVGFTYDGTEIIFLNRIGDDEKISLLNDDDKNCLQAIEDVACNNVGVTSLLKRLCMECKEKGAAVVYQNDPTHTMLIDWARRSSTLRKLLATHLPLCVKKG